MIDYGQFARHVVRPICEMFPSPKKAEQCLMAFAAHESRGATYLHQISGPAIGPWQFEPATVRLVNTYARKHRTNGVTTFLRGPERLHTDLLAAAWYARVLLWADPHALPKMGDMDGIYATYRRVWRPGRPPTLLNFRAAFGMWKAGAL